MPLLTDVQIALAHDLEAIQEAFMQGFVLPPRPASVEVEPEASEAPKDRKLKAREKIAEIVKPLYTTPEFDP